MNIDIELKKLYEILNYFLTNQYEKFFLQL